MKQIEQLRERLNALVATNDILCKGEVLRLSQELDKLIYMQYNRGIKNYKGTIDVGLEFNI
ncbi:aspartyl-phosphate phosphatase Spo0E family protein [Clostridium sp. WILCCON 0269]|uniref:Aspartyl-phosphate phosphatase Spo0E family protein n=1 Tax=Candidatus Clostridium eludens TaxID=3381663 RepID=A0ABW8SV13_9CLOT